ncbi:MAG: beta-ketoacyl-ACP synthase III, partial [Pseudomonadota bacterium]
MATPAITGSGVFTPPEVVTNAELVAAYNTHAEAWNAAHADAIAAGEIAEKPPSSSEFIVQASGIEQRHVLSRDGLLDPAVMHPWLPERADDEPGLMAEMAVAAATEALAKAGREARDIDAVLCAASNHERAYPAIAIEVQALLGTGGFG